MDQILTVNVPVHHTGPLGFESEEDENGGEIIETDVDLEMLTILGSLTASGPGDPDFIGGYSEDEIDVDIDEYDTGDLPASPPKPGPTLNDIDRFYLDVPIED